MAEWRRMAQRTKCSANKKRNKIENNSQSEAKDDPHRRYMPALKTNEMFPNSKRCNWSSCNASSGCRLASTGCHTRSTASPTDQGSRRQAHVESQKFFSLAQAGPKTNSRRGRGDVSWPKLWAQFYRKNAREMKAKGTTTQHRYPNDMVETPLSQSGNCCFLTPLTKQSMLYPCPQSACHISSPIVTHAATVSALKCKMLSRSLPTWSSLTWPGTAQVATVKVRLGFKLEILVFAAIIAGRQLKAEVEQQDKEEHKAEKLQLE